MDVQHEDREPGRLTHGARDGVRDVVELEVEEDLEAALPRVLDRGGAGGGEELRADLAPGGDAAEPVEQAVGVAERLDVERDEQPVLTLHGGIPGASAPCARA